MKKIIKEYRFQYLKEFIKNCNIQEFFSLLGIKKFSQYFKVIKPKIEKYSESQWRYTAAEILVNLFIIENNLLRLNNKTILYNQQGFDNFAITKDEIDSLRRIIRFECKTKDDVLNSTIMEACDETIKDIKNKITSHQKQSDINTIIERINNGVFSYKQVTSLKLNSQEKEEAINEIEKIEEGKQSNFGAGLIAAKNIINIDNIQFNIVRIAFMKSESITFLQLWDVINNRILKEDIYE
ncbi:hypothetical protein [Candidatus Mycoplasma mahonii]|uniref:hypothetical protein n=1 Tax=Candidatus Mycoplasma mahonii TaxID=3004105 RepID=UPI0026F012E8|nr:hypothetical protein [Candidatus Mycoplasma mahonii]WKX02372.1 hypothetical protein O3I44_03170 [Candidatus Mycoplasma mahonii]